MKILVVGAGFAGATVANYLANKGHKILIIDQRDHVAGNAHTPEGEDGILVHRYGAHLFHTNNREVWDYVNRFGEFNNYVHKVLSVSGGKLYTLPFNLRTISEVFCEGEYISAPYGKELLDRSIIKAKNKYDLEEDNLQNHCLRMVGEEIYEKIVKYYTIKQWNKHPSKLPSSIIKRIPIRYNYDDRYFTDDYQGVPVYGYTKLVENMLSHKNINLTLSEKFNPNDVLDRSSKLYDHFLDFIIYTGKIDEFFNYKYEELEYRSVYFEDRYSRNYSQGISVLNQCDQSENYTRTIEHNLFSRNNSKSSIISYEYPTDSKSKKFPMYPIRDRKNHLACCKYEELASNLTNIFFLGRLAEYRYYDMHQVIARALKLAKQINGEV